MTLGSFEYHHSSIQTPVWTYLGICKNASVALELGFKPSCSVQIVIPRPKPPTPSSSNHCGQTHPATETDPESIHSHPATTE